jgi:hypothetical protein
VRRAAVWIIGVSRPSAWQCRPRTRGLEIIQNLEQVGFAQNDKIGGAKYHRVFRRLVIPLGDTEQDHVSVLAEVEARRTHKIAHVFDEQQVESRQWQIMQRLMHEMRIKVTGGPCRDLQGRYAVCTNAGRIVVGFKITLDDRDAVSVAECHDRSLQQGRLASTRRGHEVDREDAMFVEVFAVVHRHAVVGGEQILQHFDDGSGATVVIHRQSARCRG